MTPPLTPDQVRRAVTDALEEAEFFDGLPAAEVTRHTQALHALPDAVLVSLARHLRSPRRIPA